MAYVPVPKDLTKVKTKVALNLTKRQIVCFAAALAMGLPLFFLLKGSTGTTVAAALMCAVMLPCFLFAMYEKHGQPLETVILYGRMIEIYLYCSVAPIPFATMTNREWGQFGNNYLKSLIALGFQGFLIMICVGVYAVLVNSMIIADNLHSAIFSLAAYTVILCFSLFKSGALAKSIFSAH